MKIKRIVWPIGAFLIGSGLMVSIYFGIVSLAEGFSHAIDFFIEDRWLILPLIIGFGIQSALFIILKKQLFVPISSLGASGTMTGAGGTTSTLGMVACCAHHVTDVMPILGLSAAASFLAEYQTLFMFIGLGTTIVGILVMVRILIRARKKALGYEVSSNSFLSNINIKSLAVLGAIVGILGLALGIVYFTPDETAAAALPTDSAPVSALEEGSGIPEAPEVEEQPVQEVEVPDVIEGDGPIEDPVAAGVTLWFSDLTLTDQQGSVVVDITPLTVNLENGTVYFEVGLNTHVLDLSMDLAKLASLTIGEGEQIAGQLWDAPAGGHHVSGILSFSLTGIQLTALQEANSLQISIVNLDAAERLFDWTRAE